jgi:hypothetical protein
VLKKEHVVGTTAIDPVPVVEPGITRVGDRYCRRDEPVADRRVLLGYFDHCAVTAYVSEHEVEAVCSMVRAEPHGRYIRVARGSGYVEYALRDLDDLDLHQPIEICDIAVLKDHKCQARTGCVGLMRDGALIGSFQAPADGVTICTQTPGSNCVEIVRRLVVNLYANQNCTPEPPTATTIALALCSIG